MQFFDNVKFGFSRPVAGQPVQKTNHGDAVAQMRRFNSADFDRVFFGFGRLAEIFQRTLGNLAFGKQLAKKIRRRFRVKADGFVFVCFQSPGKFGQRFDPEVCRFEVKVQVVAEQGNASVFVQQRVGTDQRRVGERVGTDV